MTQWVRTSVSPRHEVSLDGRVRVCGSKELRSRPDKDGYRLFSLWDGARYITAKAHRLVAEGHVPNPEGHPEVDHINGNRADNRAENLRWASPTSNKINRHRCNGASGVIGVRHRPDKPNPWQAYAHISNRFKSLGHFATKEAAVQARRAFGRNV